MSKNGDTNFRIIVITYNKECYLEAQSKRAGKPPGKHLTNWVKLASELKAWKNEYRVSNYEIMNDMLKM